jgi:hypothetical protein
MEVIDIHKHAQWLETLWRPRRRWSHSQRRIQKAQNKGNHFRNLFKYLQHFSHVEALAYHSDQRWIFVCAILKTNESYSKPIFKLKATQINVCHILCRCNTAGAQANLSRVGADNEGICNLWFILKTVIKINCICIRMNVTTCPTTHLL